MSAAMNRNRGRLVGAPGDALAVVTPDGEVSSLVCPRCLEREFFASDEPLMPFTQPWSWLWIDPAGNAGCANCGLVIEHAVAPRHARRGCGRLRGRR